MKCQKYLTRLCEYICIAMGTYLITYFLISNNIIMVANSVENIDISEDVPPILKLEAQPPLLEEMTTKFRLLDLEYYAQSDINFPAHSDINLNTGPCLLDLDYYTTSDFDIPVHLDPNLDTSIYVVNSSDLDSISISSLPVDLATQEMTYATTDDFIQAALAEEERYTHLKNFGVDHPYVDACIDYHSATAKQLRAMEDVSMHRDSFMEHDIFPDVLEWLSDTV